MSRLAVLICAVLAVCVAPLQGLDYSGLYGQLGPASDDRLGHTGLTIFPTLIIPTGGRFEAMGQAHTAVALDVSFFDANPAASSSLEFTELTFIHNNWIADTSIEGIYYTRRSGDLGVAVGGKFLHVPFTRYDTRTRQAGGGRYSEGSVGINVSYNFLRSFGFPGVAVGATIKGAYRYVPADVAVDQSAIGFMADAGVLSRFDFLKTYSSRTPNFAVGASARNIGPPVGGEPLPSKITAGLAYSPIRAVIIASDFILPVSLVADVPAAPPGGAVGASVRITPFLAAQGGMLLRPGGSRFSMGASLVLPDISVDINYNLDLATQFTNMDRFSIQARLNFGDEGRRAVRDLVDRYYLEAWRASALGQLDRAIEYSQRALDLDPRFTPAAELLEISLATRQLQQDLRAIDLESIGDALGDPDADGL